jgi:hypothetical protein
MTPPDWLGFFPLDFTQHVHANRDIIKSFVIVAVIMGFASGCASNKSIPGGDTVRVVDSVSGKPVPGASVVVIYPAGAGNAFITDKHGVAHIQGGFGPKEDGIHVQASVPSGWSAAVSMSEVTTNYVEIKIGPFKNATPHRDSAVLLLDNHGGFTHAGRRITLRSDGSYTDTTYTDTGVETAKNGRYTLNPERTHLVLSPEGGKTEHLYPVDYGGKQYWVREAERERVSQPAEASLRQISLRVDP